MDINAVNRGVTSLNWFLLVWLYWFIFQFGFWFNQDWAKLQQHYTDHYFHFFLSKDENLSIFGSAHRWRHHLTLSSTMSTIPAFFPIFSGILSLFFIYKSAHFLFRKCALDPENSPPTSPPTVNIMPIFSLIFLIFFFHFSFVKVCISLFGSAPWTLKNVPNIATNSEKHPQLIIASSKPMK